MAVLGLRFCVRAFPSCSKRGPLFIAVRGPLTIAASLVAEHRFQTRRLSNCGSQASLLRGMWDPPRPGLEPMSPALAGRFSTTAPPGKPLRLVLVQTVLHSATGEGLPPKGCKFPGTLALRLHQQSRQQQSVCSSQEKRSWCWIWEGKTQGEPEYMKMVKGQRDGR